MNTSSRQPSTAFSAARIFELSLPQMLWSRRSILLALLVCGPMALATVPRGAWIIRPSQFTDATVGFDIYGLMIWLLYVRFIVPVLGVFYGTSMIADEVEDKTITYLFTRPIQRRAVILGKYAAYLVCTLLLVLPSAMIVFFLLVPVGGGTSIGVQFPVLIRDLGALAIGLAAYGAVFAYVGARVRRPLLAGLAFVFGWEPAMVVIPGYLKRLSVAYYLQALIPHARPPDDAGPPLIVVALRGLLEEPSALGAVVGLAVIIGLCLWAAGRAVEQREYVLEQ